MATGHRDRVKAEWGGVEGLNLTGSPHTLQAESRSVRERGAAPYDTLSSSSIQWIARNGDILTALIPPVADAGGHVGFDTTQTVSTKLFGNDALLAGNDWIFVGADGLSDEAATYRLEQDATGDIGGLATRTRSVFTFRDPAAAFTVRFAPRLDRQYVPAGSTQQIPLTALDQTGKPVRVAQLGMAVSYDDGATWSDAPVALGFATVRYPASAGYVSIPVHGKDAAATQTTQTVIRAYRLR